MLAAARPHFHCGALLCLLLAFHAQGSFPAEPPEIITEGYKFKFTIRVKVTVALIPGLFCPTIFSSSAGSASDIELCLGGALAIGNTNKIRLTVGNTPSHLSSVWTGVTLGFNSWETVTVEKYEDQACITMDGSTTCTSPWTGGDIESFRVDDSWTLQWGSHASLEVFSFLQEIRAGDLATTTTTTTTLTETSTTMTQTNTGTSTWTTSSTTTTSSATSTTSTTTMTTFTSTATSSSTTTVTQTETSTSSTGTETLTSSTSTSGTETTTATTTTATGTSTATTTTSNTVTETSTSSTSTSATQTSTATTTSNTLTETSTATTTTTSNTMTETSTSSTSTSSTSASSTQTTTATTTTTSSTMTDTSTSSTSTTSTQTTTATITTTSSTMTETSTSSTSTSSTPTTTPTETSTGTGTTTSTSTPTSTQTTSTLTTTSDTSTTHTGSTHTGTTTTSSTSSVTATDTTTPTTTETITVTTTTTATITSTTSDTKTGTTSATTTTTTTSTTSDTKTGTTSATTTTTTTSTTSDTKTGTSSVTATVSDSSRTPTLTGTTTQTSVVTTAATVTLTLTGTPTSTRTTTATATATTTSVAQTHTQTQTQTHTSTQTLTGASASTKPMTTTFTVVETIVGMVTTPTTTTISSTYTSEVTTPTTTTTTSNHTSEAFVVTVTTPTTTATTTTSTSEAGEPEPTDVSDNGELTQTTSTATSLDLVWNLGADGPQLTGPDAWLATQSSVESSLLQELVANAFAGASWRQAGLGTSLAWHLNRTRNVVRIADTGAELEFPASLFDGLEADSPGTLPEEFAVVATSFNPAELTGAAAVVNHVRAAMNVEIWSLTYRRRKRISNTADPILVKIPVEDSEELTCQYWNVAEGRWAQDGVEVMRHISSKGQLTCATTHLTLFAGIWRSISRSVLCAQLELLTPYGIQQLSSEDGWQGTPAATCFFVLLGLLFVILAGSCLVDTMRFFGSDWSDEYFLVPMCSKTDLEEVLGAEDRENSEDYELFGLRVSTLTSVTRRSSRVSRTASRPKTPRQKIFAACLAPLVWCKQSSAARDALDDVVSRWFAHFSEVRDFVEGLWQGMGFEETEEGQHGRLASFVRAVMDTLVMRSASQQAGMKLGLSQEVVDFVLKDEDLGEILLHAAMLQPLKDDTSLDARRLRAWQDLHQEVTAGIHRCWHHSAQWNRLPGIACRRFLLLNPIVALFHRNHFLSSSLRVLFFCCELFGSFMVAAFFFQSSGEVKGKRSRGECNGAGESGLAPLIGRIIVIGLGSLLLAGMPVAVLSSLHNRSFKKFDYEGCEEWKRQLLVWKIQDVLLWVFGTSYAVFCAFFTTLFLANSRPEDQPAWGLSALISVTEDVLVTPLALAVLVPLFASASVALMSWIAGQGRSEVLHERQKDLESKGNLGFSVMSI